MNSPTPVQKDLVAVIRILNALEGEGFIERYAIGDDAGATFYLDESSAAQVEVFVSLPGPEGTYAAQLAPTIEYLNKRGYTMSEEFVIVGEWKVQLLAPTSALAEEALAGSRESDTYGTPARVVAPEHLAAIALQDGKSQSNAKVLQFVESGILNNVAFQAILARHLLRDRWSRFEIKFLVSK